MNSSHYFHFWLSRFCRFSLPPRWHGPEKESSDFQETFLPCKWQAHCNVHLTTGVLGFERRKKEADPNLIMAIKHRGFKWNLESPPVLLLLSVCPRSTIKSQLCSGALASTLKSSHRDSWHSDCSFLWQGIWHESQLFMETFSRLNPFHFYCHSKRFGERCRRGHRKGQ